jgi:hypothetical protein
VRPISPASDDARSPEERGALYRTAGTAGGLFLLGRRERRVVVVFLLVWDSATVGAAPHTVSATSRAMRIFLENIFRR